MNTAISGDISRGRLEEGRECNWWVDQSAASEEDGSFTFPADTT